MAQLFKISITGAAVGGLAWLLLCLFVPAMGGGDWMAANSFSLSNWLMAGGAAAGPVAWLADRIKQPAH